MGKAVKVVITDSEAAEEAYTDSGRYIGIMVNESVELLEVEISGVPEEMESRFFRYLEDDESDGLIFDLTRIEN